MLLSEIVLLYLQGVLFRATSIVESNTFENMNFFKIFFATLLSFIIAMVLITIIFVGSIVGWVVGASSAPRVKSESVLVVDLKEPIVDSPEINPLASINLRELTIDTKITTLDAIRAIEIAASDDNIKGIYIRPSLDNSIPMSTLEELRAEIQRFKDQGKFVVAYADTYSQGAYYLASVADSLYLQPEGGVVWQGVATTPMFYRGLFDKLDLEVEVFRPTSCLYKSAVEPLTRKSMSPENRQQSEALVGSIWESVVDEVSQSRQLANSQLNTFANSLCGLISAEAKSVGLVDDLIYEDQLESRFSDFGVRLNDQGRANRISLGDYVLSTNTQMILSQGGSSDEVAVIYAEGVIVDGEGDIDEVGSETFVRLLREARLDNNIKSVVIRVNSPGGSALAADVIWREVALLRKEKPVVVSMGEYAASGGYYISAPADVILADKLTITGSIGVYGVLFDIEGTLSQNLGITSDVAKSNSSADFMRTSRPITAAERAIMMRSVDQVYDTFTTHVSQGRNLPLDRVHSVSGGRVWSGVEAQQIGLVDGVGGLKTAILIAAERGGVAQDFTIRELLPTSDDITALFGPINNVFANSNHVTKHYNQILKKLKPLESKNGVVMFSPVGVEWN